LILSSSFAFLFTILPASGEDIKWESSFRDSLKRAKLEDKPLFIAVNMDGQPVCEELANKHYKSKRIVKLSKNLINLFASRYYHKGGTDKCPRAECIKCAQHQQIEKDMRKHLPEMHADGDVIAPNHIFLYPDGKVILSVPYMITEGQLEWCMKEAVRKVRQDFTWGLGNGGSAPKKVMYGKVAAPGLSSNNGGKAQPLSKKELSEALSEIKKSGRRGGYETAEKYFSSLIVTEDKKAIEVVKSWLSSRWIFNYGRGKGILHDIGRTSPPVYWSVVAPFVSHEKIEVRNEAVVALEQLADPKALKALKKQKTSEKDVKVKANIIRAIASTGRGNKSAESTVLKTAEREKKTLVRISGIVGLVYLEDRKTVNEVLIKSLKDKDPGIRAAAAYTIAMRRETDLIKAIDETIASEGSAEVRVYMRAAANVLKGGNVDTVKGVLKDYALDTIDRDRVE